MIKLPQIAFLGKFKELFLYGIIGAFCASLDFCIYTLAIKAVGEEYLLFCNSLGVVCGIVTSFTLNRQFNFKVKDKTGQRFLVFLGVGLLGLLVSSGMLYYLVTVLGYNELISKLATIAVVSILQFLLNKAITFSR